MISELSKVSLSVSLHFKEERVCGVISHSVGM
jgi:hypothetical protein